MPVRKIIFWAHLAAGLLAGLVIAVMCFTGTALAFEKQIVARAERDARLVSPPPATTPRLSLDDLLRRVREQKPDARPDAIVVSADPRAAVAFSLGRDSALYANPYTGELHTPDAAKVRAFLHMMEEWHRWLALSGHSRSVGKLINGVASAAFLLLAVTGLYLWLPRNGSWRGFRAVALINPRLAGKARDFNWHNVIGLWSAPILIVLTLTALPMSFRWANHLVYRLAGETPPAPSAPGAGNPNPTLPAPPDGARPLSRDAQFTAVQNAYPAWEQITLRLTAPDARGRPPSAPEKPGASPSADPSRPERHEASARRSAASLSPQPLTFIVKLPSTWPRTATTTVVLNPFTAEILRHETFADLTPGRQTRTWTRFLHTGEALGLVGQLLAGLASLGGCFLVYTGFALAWRRFFCRTSA